MRINERMKRALSILLCVMMLVQYVPTHAFAATTDNLCEHHTEHTAECGYREGSAGSACTHEHSEDCYAILECLHTCGEECADGCNHECTVENGCITMELDCRHVHGDCGYSEGTAEVPCGHVHNESCGYAEAVAGNPCANAETDPECDHSGDCGYVAAVEGQPCGHTACDDTCGYAPATAGTPCTHVCEVKVDSDDSCYKLLCSHSSGGHDDVCGYAAAVEAHECHYECAECAAAAASEQPSEESSDPAPVCTCGTDDPAIHATTCGVYVAPENPQCFCVEKCTEPNVWCDVCGFDVTGCTGEAKPTVGGKMAISSYSGDTVYVHLTLKAVDVSGNEVSTTFNSYIEQDIIDNREGYGADFYVGDTYCLSGFDIDGYTVKDEEITFTVYSSGNISINSGNASVEYGSDTTYIVIPVNCIGGDRVTIDCSTIDLNVNPYHAWGPGWYADGSVDLHELILTEPYIFILENSESMTKDNVEYIRILGGAILEAGTLADGVLVYAENGKIQSGTFISHVNVYADGEICGGTFNNVVNKGIISAGTFNGELTNYGTITNQGNIQLGEDFVLVQNGNVDCNAHIWRDGICRLCSVTCQHSWTNGTCTVCDLVCGHSGGTTKPTDNGNGTHSVTCTVCGGITEVHTFDENGTCVCGVNLFTVSGSTLTIDGTLGGKTEATEEDITVLVNKIQDCVDNGITTIIVTGSEPAMIDMGSWINTAIGEAIYRVSKEESYNGKIDLILQDVTQIVDQEFDGAHALNSINLPKVTTVGNGAFYDCQYLEELTFGSVVTAINHNDRDEFHRVGEIVEGCDLVLNCGQLHAATEYQPNLNTNTWWKDDEWKSITLTHTEGTAAACTTKAVCSVCGESYGEVGGHTPAEDATYTDNGDGTHSYTCTDCKETVAEDHSGGTATCTTLAVCTVCGVSYGDVDTTNHDETVAFDSNGFCPKGCYEPATDSDSDGVYEIGNAGQLYWFAAQVNSGEKSINAVLMHDIDLTNHTWTPIGVTAMGEGVTDGYTGTFDGQGHVISNITFATPTSAMAAGIFGTVQSGGTVKNLGVENLTFDNNDYDHRAAGIAGQLLADSTISDCYVINSTVKASSRVVGGIVGMNKGTVKNCYTYNMTLAAYNNRFGGISGDYSGGKLENCYTDYSALASSEAGTTTNCEAGVSAERFASGEVAYLLGDPWGQTIGTDTSPNFTGGTVYQVTNCKNETVYSNTNETIGHSYENGICTVCGVYEPATDSDSDGYYEITNAGQLYWFAQQVNSGSTAINGELTADIVVNENVLTADGALNGDGSNFRVWTPIGNNSYPYIGEFRGNKHTVSGLYFNGGADYVGLFGYVGSGNTEQVSSVQNVGVIDSYLNGGSYVGGVVGYNDIGGTVQYVYNTGNIQGSSQYVGGVVGRNQYIVRYAYNTGTVFAQNYAGGVVGHNNYILEYAYNTGSASDWFQYGSVTGYNRDATKLKDCYYLADSETDELDGTTAKTAGQFEIGEVAYLLGAPFGQNIGTDTYPGFTGGTVYHGNCGGGAPYSNDAEEVMNHNCNAENGYRCSNTLLSGGVCNVYESASQNAEGYYEIYNASQLYWFAEQVNGGAKSINAVLMNDIDLTNHTWTPIGVTAMGESVTDGYTGTFDGQGHVISNIMFAAPTSAMAAGIFGTVQSGGTVKNLGVENLTFDNNDYDHRAGGIAGQLLAGSTISDCYVINSTVKASSRVVGGIVGMNRGTVKNCYTCNVTLAAYNNRFGGISGDYSGGKLENCYTDYSALASSEAGTTTNCEAGVSAERFASGEIAYALGDSWGQTIGTDGCPVYGGATVYQVVNIGCPEQGEYVYSNVNEAVAAAHKYTNGFCACGEYEEAVQNTDGYYVIDNAGKLFWFAQQVNGGNNTINAVLTADIDLENRNWTPIGTQNESVSPNVKVPYMGVFDGQCHVIKNLSIHVTDGREAGLFGRAQDATLLNFGVVDAAVVSDPVNGTGYRAGIVAGELHRCTVANVYSAGNLTVTTTHAQAGGIAGECADSTLKNCFTTYGCLTASNAALPTAVTNCYYLASSANADSAGTFKTGEQFESGEVAYLLGDAYGQTIGTDVTPNFNGAAVYYGYLSCADDAQPVYSNNGQASEEKPDHAGALTYENNTADGTHIGTYTCCGSTFTEEHTEGTAATCVSNPICSVCKYEYGEPSNSAHAFADDNETCKYCQQIIVAKVSRDGVVSYYTAIEDVAPNDDESNYAKLTLLANYTMKGNGNLGYTSLERVGDVTITVPNEYTLMVYYTAEWIDAEGYFVRVGKWDGRRDYGKFITHSGRSYLLRDLTIESFGRTSGHKVTVTKDATLTLTGASSISEQLVVYGELVLTENATLRNTGTTYLANDIYQSIDDIPAGLTGGSVQIKGITYTYVSGGSTDEKDHAPYWSCNSHVCQDSKADCITRDHCDHCGDAFGEFGGHTIDITTGSCVLCSEYIAVATVTDGTTTLHADTGENLSTAIKQLMDGGSRTLTVDLPGYSMITDVCSAVSDASADEVQTVHLTVKGLTMIGKDTGFASMAQLATLSLPDVTYLYEYALLNTELERLELTAEEEITVEREAIDSDIVGLVDLVLCCNKADEVSDGVYWKGFTFKSVTFTEHDYVDGVCTVCGTKCDHKDSTHTTAANNGDGTHSFACSVCSTAVIEDHTFNETGKCVCTVQAVAKVNDYFNGIATYYYETLPEALAAAKALGSDGVGDSMGVDVYPLADDTGDFTIPAGLIYFYGEGYTFSGTVTNNGYIFAGTFSGEVKNNYCIYGGTFNGKVTNDGTIYNIVSGNMELGENFSIENKGTIVCQVHFWKDGVCRLCAEACDHTQATPSYTWTEDPITTLTVTVSCTACGETFTGSTEDIHVTISDDGFTTTYTATVTLDGKDYTDTKIVSNEVTRVNITWGEMDFTYTDESGWNTPDTAWVQVENTGNTDVSVTYDYVTERTDITGSFFDGTSTVTAPVVIDAEAAKKIWLRLDGTPSEALNNTNIGSVKLTIE